MANGIREVSVVFHLDEIGKTSMTLNNMTNLLADESIKVLRLGLVINSEAISALIKESEFDDAITSLMHRNVEIYACRNAMKANGIAENDLICGAISVPSGVGQLAILQSEHCAYIRP